MNPLINEPIVQEKFEAFLGQVVSDVAAVKLDGATFWKAGDLGGDYTSIGKTDWTDLVFDPSLTAGQRQAIQTIHDHLFMKSVNVSVYEAPIEWTTTKDRAVAKLDGGKMGEMIITRFPGMTDEPVVVENLKYWNAPRNEGFVLMPNEVQAYRAGDHPFEFKGTNGFMITLDITSADIN